jgi:ATP-dependent exoDNAse (exonuclease V) beta subunit
MDCRQYQAFPEQIGTFSTLLQDALEFDAVGGSLDDYLAYTALLADNNQNKEIVYNDDDFDAVCITNFHQSKGREWPICIIAAAAQRYATKKVGSNLDALIDTSAFAAIRAENPGNEAFAQWSCDSTVAVKAGMFQTPDYAPADSCESVILGSELARLYYVALTRAKYSLVLTSHHSGKTRKSTFAGQLLDFPDCLNDFEHIESYCETDPYALRRKLNIAEKASASAQPTITLEQYRKIRRQQSLLSQARSSVVVSKHDDDDAPVGFESIMPPIDYQQDIARYMETIVRRPEQPGQFGTVIHRALELCRLNPDAGTQKKALNQAVDELGAQELETLTNPVAEAGGDEGFPAFIPDYQLMLDTLATVVRDSPTIAAARESDQIFFEMPLAALLDGKSVRAYSDLIFANPDDTWTIADFKNATTPDSLTNYYRQLWAYKHIFEQATGERVTCLALIYCLGNGLDLTWEV